MRILAHLIESYPREYGSWSWAKEKLSIPLEAHDKAQLSEIFQVFFQKFRAVIFYLLAHPAETAYLSFRDRELSNDVPACPIAVKISGSSHLFVGGHRPLPSCRNYRKP